MPRHRHLRALPSLSLLAVLAGLLLLVAGCGSGGNDEPAGLALLTGTLQAPEEVPLPPESVATVRLYDMSAEPARIIGEQIVGPAGQFPVAFSLTYNRAVIAPGRDYAIRASIRAGRYVIWSEEAPVPVLTRGHPDEVAIVLAPAR